MAELVALSTTGSPGWVPCGEISFRGALATGPSYIGAQHGSSDCGPLYLGAQVPYAIELPAEVTAGSGA